MIKKIAFICYGNACRSQLAEALFKEIGKGRYEVYSAGTNPLGHVPGEVDVVLRKRGVPLQGQYSKGLDEIPLEEMDYIVNMGYFPVASFLPACFTGEAYDWDIDDPYGDGVAAFDAACRMIETKLRAFYLEHLKE